VKGLAKAKTGPDGKPLSSAELRVLKALAYLHNEYVWCAWPSTHSLAQMTDMSQSHCRRTLAGLVQRGVLLRFFVESERWGETTSNEYEFVGLSHEDVSQETRDMVFKYKRTRAAVQLSLRRGGRQRKLSGTSGERSAEQNELQDVVAGASMADDARISVGGPDASVAELDDCDVVEKSVGVVVGDNHSSCGGQPLWLPVESLRELHMDCIPPVFPHADAELCKSPPDAELQVCLVMAKTEARATASAKATATTSSLRSPSVSMEGTGKTGMSSRGRVISISRGRRAPDVRSEREQLDGIEAALWDVMAHVLGRCGLALDNTRRSLRVGVMNAIQHHASSGDQSIAQLGDRMAAAWLRYLEHSWALFRKVELRRFVADSYWLDDNRWDWDKRALREGKGSRL
jgi:hypothetical protein